MELILFIVFVILCDSSKPMKPRPIRPIGYVRRTGGPGWQKVEEFDLEGRLLSTSERSFSSPAKPNVE